MKLAFEKYQDGLLPAIVQDSNTMQVLMLGFMNEEALQKTIATGLVTFFSRSKNRLWTKGEESGNYLEMDRIIPDCDNDTLLVLAIPGGPVCHKGNFSCFRDKSPKGFIYELEKVISKRVSSDDRNSYTKKLFEEGINKVAQKVGEEAVELVIEAKDNNQDLLVNEAADLIYHFLILLKMKKLGFEDVEKVLLERHTKST